MTTQHLIRVTTYDELHRIIDAFASGGAPFIIVKGSGGVGKSKAVEQRCSGIRFLKGRLSPADFYKICFACRPTTPICLDDIGMDDLNANLEQLRQLTETDRIRTMQWNTGMLPEI